MNDLTKTKAWLEDLGNPLIGVELKDGSRKFGKAFKFTQFKIYIKDESGDVIDIPRRIITRALILIPGGKGDEPTEVSTEDKPSSQK